MLKVQNLQELIHSESDVAQMGTQSEQKHDECHLFFIVGRGRQIKWRISLILLRYHQSKYLASASGSAINMIHEFKQMALNLKENMTDVQYSHHWLLGMQLWVEFTGVNQEIKLLVQENKNCMYCIVFHYWMKRGYNTYIFSI